jgi:hypothetical protein
VRLRIDQGALVVRNGFSHYPQENEELRFFPGDQKLPPRIIALDCDCALSLDAIAWLGQQDVPLILLNWQGEVTSIVGGPAPHFDQELRQAQMH